MKCLHTFCNMLITPQTDFRGEKKLFRKLEKKINQSSFHSATRSAIGVMSAKHCGFGTFTSKAILLGSPSEDLRLIAVVADLEQNLKDYNLEEIDKSMDFNGDHSGEVYKESCMYLEHLSKINN